MKCTRPFIYERAEHSLYDVCCVLSGVCVLCAVCCVLWAVCCELSGVCVLCAVWCVLCTAVCCVLCGVWCVVWSVCCVLCTAVCCVLRAVYSVLSAVLWAVCCVLRTAVYYSCVQHTSSVLKSVIYTVPKYPVFSVYSSALWTISRVW